ncbi:MAG: T9SS C-terminal target domain-containing protein [Verrucomicrobiota bacterium]
MKLTYLPLVALLAAPAALLGADIAVNSNITSNRTWTKTNTYILDGRVFVTDGVTLTIEPGTVIKGKARSAQDASALVIARGGRINASGTAAEPIVFTSDADNLNGNLGQNDRGLWGGVVILGRARTNTASGQGNIEGIPTTEPLGIYGGTDDADNSGVFRYVSIRHAGSLLGPNNELNGLTMGAVGSGTTIEYVEVFANADDGFEWFGGTVNGKYLVSAFNDDDAFDWDEGYRGKLQFLFTIQDPQVGNQAIEGDGGTTPEDGQPYAIPTIYNYTAIGSGAASANALSLGPIFRDNTGGKVFNSIFHDFRGYAWRIETESAQREDSAKRLAAGDILIANNLFGTFGAGTAATSLFVAPNATAGGPAPASNYTVAHITEAARQNRINTDPQFVAISRARDGQLDPRLRAGSPALQLAATPPNDGFFTPTTYLGAFTTSGNWAYAWTKLGRDGYFSAASALSDPGAGSTVVVNAGSTTKLSNLSTRLTLVAGSTAFPGFFLNGAQSQTVMIRAVGPGLAPLGVANVVADPVLELYSGQNKIGENDDWSGTQAAQLATQVGAFPLPAGSRDAVLLATLAPGAYTLQVRGKTGGGEVIIEVYEID